MQNAQLPISEPAAGTIQKSCEVDGCSSARWYGAAVAPLVYVCKQHSGYESCGVMTIGAPETGDDFVLIDGVEYVVRATLHAMSKKLTVVFAGQFALAKSTPTALRFEREGQFIEVPESSLRELVAI